MLSFHPLTLDDKPRIDGAVFAENSRSADFNFGSMFLWDGRYRQMVTDAGQPPIVLCCAYEHPVFPFPVGVPDLAGAVSAMGDYAEAQGFPLVIRGLEQRHTEALEALFPGAFAFTEDSIYADYIYDAEKLRDLPGKKLHGKRNHISRFTAEHDWAFVPLTADLFPACRGLLSRWSKAEGNSPTAEGEHEAIERAFLRFDALDLLGGVLFADGEPVAFTVGEKIAADTFDVHFEKALADINGAYPMVNREFVRLILERDPGIRYINREDDMGLENLRKSKESYCPDILLRKFTARRAEKP